MNLTIMIIDDDYDLRMLMDMFLSGEGYRVITAEEGQQALDKIDQEIPSMIFLDMKMPGMDGWEFARELRSRYGHRIPVIVFTAAADPKARAEEADAEDFLSKPFSVEDILKKIVKFTNYNESTFTRSFD